VNTFVRAGIAIKTCTYLSDAVTLNVAGALYTVKGIVEDSAVD